jgi:hypothetical protein
MQWQFASWASSPLLRKRAPATTHCKGQAKNQAWVRIAEISEVEENKKGSKRD